MEWNDGCLFHRVMLAKRIQVSAKVSVAEGSVEGKAFGVGGKPQSKVRSRQGRCQESLCPNKDWTVRKMSGLFLTKMSSLVRSGPKALPELCGGQCEPFLLPLNCLQRDMGWRSHVPTGALMDGPISDFLSLPVCPFLPLLTCVAATHQRWGDRGTQRGTDPTAHITEKDTGWKPRLPCLCRISNCLIISSGTGRGRVAFCPPLPGCNDRSSWELLPPSAWPPWHTGLDSFKKRRWT